SLTVGLLPRVAKLRADFSSSWGETKMQAGDVISWQRTFTHEDIRVFSRLSGDEGEHHRVADDHGRLMAHGLLTATGIIRPAPEA
ncbi:MAG: hypothetical protein ACREBG_15550, partial [Pyrinomonadaceae bacterium]